MPGTTICLKTIFRIPDLKGRQSVGDVSGLGMAESRSTVSDRDMEAAERDTVLPADMASRRAG